MSPEQKEAYEKLGYNLTRPNASGGASFFNEGGFFPSPDNTTYDTVQIKKLNPHPWTSDLRAMQRMLQGEIKIPHVAIRTGLVNPFTGERASTLYPTSKCDICNKALRLRFEYQEMNK